MPPIMISPAVNIGFSSALMVDPMARGGGGKSSGSEPPSIDERCIRVRTPWQLENVLARFPKSPLARAFVGGNTTLPVTKILMSHADVIPKKGKPLMSFIADTHAVPLVRSAVNMIFGRGRDAVFGNAMTSSVFRQMLMGDRRTNSVFVTLSADGKNVESVRVNRGGSGEHFEWVDTGRVDVGDGERYSFPIIGQRIHFGTQLPSLTNPSETAVQAGIDFAYKPLQGVLESIGPRKISEGIIDKNFALGQHVPGRDVAEGFRKLIAPDQDIEFVRSSRAFLPNSGILGKVLSDVVLDPSSGIDMSRVMVHSLSLYAGDICRLYGDNLDGSYEVNIQPIAIHNMAKGQLLEAVMKMWLPHDRLMSYANIKLFVRGNLSRENVQEDAFVHARDSADMDGTVNFIAMNNLRGFASINGDFNPLHLVNAVGYAADIPQGVINPGFGTIAQIEAALRTAMDGLPLSNIRARFIKPVLPSKEYEIRHWRDGHYQVFEAGSSSDKVIVDGAFVALGD